MIVNVWREPPERAEGLTALARQRGLPNVPAAMHDVRVAWDCRESDAPGGVMLERHLPSRQYSAVAPDFDALLDALAWEAREWIAIEIWRARRKDRRGPPQRNSGHP